MLNKFAKHYNEYSNVYDELMNAGVIDEADVKAAGNLGGKYSYFEQDEANKRIHDYIKKFISSNEGNDYIEKLGESFPEVQKFEPDPNNWQDYDQEQMGRLAESLHYNWNNKEDRSKMMRELQNNTVRENKKKIYEDYKKENPFSSWINENVLAPNASERSKRGDDNTNKDIALDALNVASYLTPGGLGKTAFQKGALMAGDIAANAALGVAQDLNQDRELGLHNIVAPVFGAGLGRSIEAAPQLIKQVTSWLGNGSDAGQAGKNVGDKIEDWFTNTFTDKASTAKKALQEEAEGWAKKPTVRKNISVENQNKLLNQGVIPEPNAYEKRFAKDKADFAEHPEKFIAKKDVAYKQEMLKDPNFRTVIQDYTRKKNMNVAKKVGDKLLKGIGTAIFKQGGRAAPYIQQNTARHKESDAERSDIEWFKENYAMDWEAGFVPRGKDDEPIMKAYREWKEENKKPSVRSVMGGM